MTISNNKILTREVCPQFFGGTQRGYSNSRNSVANVALPLSDRFENSVFMTNSEPNLLREYAYRWKIESEYKSVKRFMAVATSKNFVLRFFHFAFACLLYSIWRAVDLLVQIEATGKYDRSPVVTANTVVTLLKRTGIG
jgi:hypothetical protein